ncbi:MAG: amino acid permease [Deltaproteobacteria bacterium]|nr:amino acid permease [Deltaproteobacteria bacterium]
MDEKDQLKRTIGLGTAVILVIANMIGTGVFTTSGFIMQDLANPASMLICWFIGGILALTGALCYGELGAIFPKAGGEYIFLRESIGKPFGFLSGWVSLIVGFSAPIAAASIAFSTYLYKSIGVESAGKEILNIAGIITISPVTLTGIAVIILFSVVHWYSLNFGSNVQNLLTSFKILVILAFIVLGLFIGKGSMENFSSGPVYTSLFTGKFATSLIFISFAYSGWNAAAYIGSEIKDPSRNIPLSLFWGTVIVMILYLLLNVIFIYALTISEMSGVVEVGAKAAVSLFGVKTGSLFALAITICLMSAISAMIMTGPRVYYAMARDHVFPQWFGDVSPGHTTPGKAILLQSVIAIIMVVTSSFDKLLMYIGFTLSLFAMLTVLGLMILRLKNPGLERPYKTFGYPVTPVLFILSSLWIIVYSIRDNPFVLLYGGGTIILGIIIYCYYTFKFKIFKDYKY